MEKNSNQSHESVSRRTRSQAAPEWTVNSSLILVNEITAVVGECQNAFSSFQKWRIISENYSVLDVPRNVNQCRRKWSSLYSEYKKIERWESQTGVDSYWSLGNEKRKELGLPDSFDDELYTAIGNLLRARDSQLDSDCDSKEEVDTADFTSESGSKRGKRLLVPLKGCQREKSKRVSMEETLDLNLAELMHKKRNGKKPDKKFTEGMQHMNHAKEIPNISSLEVGPQDEWVQEDSLEVGPQNERVEEDYVEVGAQNERVQEDIVEVRPQNDSVQEDYEEVGLQNDSVEEVSVKVKPQNDSVEEDSLEVRPENESVQEASVEMGPQNRRVQDDQIENREGINIEDKERVISAKLRASSEMVHAIVNENPAKSGDNRSSGFKTIDDSHYVFIRRQGDKLIACLEDIVNTLRQADDLSRTK